MCGASARGADPSVDGRSALRHVVGGSGPLIERHGSADSRPLTAYVQLRSGS
jgi:hypothetical protein